MLSVRVAPYPHPQHVGRRGDGSGTQGRVPGGHTCCMDTFGATLPLTSTQSCISNMNCLTVHKFSVQSAAGRGEQRSHGPFAVCALKLHSLKAAKSHSEMDSGLNPRENASLKFFLYLPNLPKSCLIPSCGELPFTFPYFTPCLFPPLSQLLEEQSSSLLCS